MVHTRSNDGVCSVCTTVRLSGEIIQEVSVLGGCDGNLKGICTLLQGRNAGEAAALLKGIGCGNKITSCPNEIAKCIEEALVSTKEAS